MSNFADLKLAVEGLSGGVNTVILDDVGMPSIMYVQPKLLLSDLVDGASEIAHPAFIVNDVEKSKAYISKYQNIVMNSRAYSLPMQDPAVSLTWTNANTYCRNKGEGWGVQPYALFSAIALWCKKNGFQPHGNNNYGSDITYSWEKGIMCADTSVYRTLTGSGPASWYHDNTRHGIADMNGNVGEWASGFRFVYGELQVIPYANCMLATCDMGTSSDEWKCIDADGNLVDQGSDNTLHLDYPSSKFIWTTSSDITLKNASTALSGITCDDSVNDGAKRFLRSMRLLPEDGDTDYGSDVFYLNSQEAERFPNLGGCWTNGAYAGVFFSGFANARSNSYTNRGFRSAYYE